MSGILGSRADDLVVSGRGDRGGHNGVELPLRLYPGSGTPAERGKPASHSNPKL